MFRCCLDDEADREPFPVEATILSEGRAEVDSWDHGAFDSSCSSLRWWWLRDRDRPRFAGTCILSGGDGAAGGGDADVAARAFVSVLCDL